MALRKGNESTDEIAGVLRRFGDEQSTLWDRFERLSFEAHLNRAMLARSFSEPRVAKSLLAVEPPVLPHVSQGRRGSGFNRILKKLFRPFFGRKGKKSGGKQAALDPQNPKNWKVFSRSMRF
ncbi:hypothetical protein SLE2022_342000 [Rubroshorea leprosula]